MAERLADFKSGNSAIATDDRTSRSWRTSVPLTVEPVVFLISLSTMLTSPILTNLFLFHTCETSLGINRSICEQLTDKMNNDSSLEVRVQRVATYFTMGKSLIESCVPALLSLYIGPWSDLNGRKPLIMWPLFGFALTYIVFLVDSLFPALPPAVLMVCSLPAALCGGFISFISGIFSYISDISQPEKRPLRMGMIEVALLGGDVVGMFLSSYIFNFAGSFGYITIFSIAAMCCFLSCLYCWLFIRESVINNESEYPCCCAFNGLFKNRHVVSMLSVFWERRPNNGRAITLMVIVILASCIFTLDGEGAIAYLFTRDKFHFDLHDYSTFAAITIIINVVGVFLGMHVLSRCLKCSPVVLAGFGFIIKTAAAVITAVSPYYWYMYIASGINILGACVGPWCRAFLSLSVPSADIGKVFSLTASLEALAPLAASTLYTLLYNSTMNSLPGAVFLLSGGVFLVDAFLLLIVVFLYNRNEDDQNLRDNLLENDKTDVVPETSQTS